MRRLSLCLRAVCRYRDGEQGREAGKLPYPLKGIPGAYPDIATEPQYRSRDVKTCIVQRLPVQGDATPVLRSGVLCMALERSHHSHYPPTPMIELSDACRGARDVPGRCGIMSAGECRREQPSSVCVPAQVCKTWTGNRILAVWFSYEEIIFLSFYLFIFLSSRKRHGESR